MQNKTFLIASDIHGSLEALEQTLELFQKYKADKLILLGDIFGYDSDKMVQLLNPIASKLDIVRGNNDSYFEQKNAKFQIFDSLYENFNGTIGYLCHGHKLNDMMLDSYGAKIIFQGHLHRPLVLREQGVLRICPGSIAFPRMGSSKSFAFLKDNKIQILSVNGEIIQQIYF